MHGVDKNQNKRIKNMSKMIEIAESVLNKNELHYVKVNPEVIHLQMSGATIAIAADEERSVVKIQGYISVGLEGDKLTEAYKLVNEWNCDHVVKYYIDNDGDMMTEWFIDTEDGAFNEMVFNAGFGRIVSALREAKEPVMKLRYT